MKTFTQYINEEGIEDRLGPKATKARDRMEIVRQKKHLDNKAKEYDDQSKRENGGGAAEAKAISFQNAKKAIHNEEVGGGVATNSVAGVAGTGDSRLPASQREPGVSKKRNPTLGYFRRK